jgi:hypothetical protein
MYVKSVWKLWETKSADIFTFEIRKGTLEAIKNSAFVWRQLSRVGVDRICFLSQQDSYSCTNAKQEEEHFEKIQLSVGILGRAMQWYSWWDNSFLVGKMKNPNHSNHSTLIHKTALVSAVISAVALAAHCYLKKKPSKML